MNLRELREMRVVTVEGIARTLRVPESWIGTIESAPLDTVPLGTVRRYVEALGCRLDVLAQHIDVAHWLTVPCSHEGIGLPGCTTCDPSTGPRAGASRREAGSSEDSTQSPDDDLAARLGIK